MPGANRALDLEVIHLSKGAAIEDLTSLPSPPRRPGIGKKGNMPRLTEFCRLAAGIDRHMQRLASRGLTET